MTDATDATLEKRFACAECGATLEFRPGADSLACAYCGYLTAIATPAAGAGTIEEVDFHAELRALEEHEAHDEVHVVRCTACAAETSFDKNVTSSQCAFCGSNIVAQARSKRRITPRALLPFGVERRRGLDAFQGWIGGLWFAPARLTRMAHHDDRLHGVYVPYWTFDARTTADYQGQRGDDYFDTERYSVMQNGRSVARTRQVRRTRWRHASGRVANQFDDLLILASTSLPAKLAEHLEPWDLTALIPYADAYLAGFRAESYQVDLQQGFDHAANKMDAVIRQTVRRDIGGDQQRIHALQTHYEQVTFKHVLLPIWISSYRFRGKVYRFVVNGRTGEVQGERPYSIWKITLVVLGVLALIAAIAFVAQRPR